MGLVHLLADAAARLVVALVVTIKADSRIKSLVSICVSHDGERSAEFLHTHGG